MGWLISWLAGSLVGNVLGPFFNFIRGIVPKLFNKVWLAMLLFVSIGWTMFHKAKTLLGTLVSKIDSLNLTNVSGHAPNVGGSETLLTLRGWLEMANAVFPVNECFTFLVGYIALLVILWALSMLMKLIPNPFGFLGR